MLQDKENHQMLLKQVKTMYKIVCVGKIKEDFITKGINEYTKRISAFTKLDIVEVKEVNTSNISNNMKEEANNILQKINKNY